MAAIKCFWCRASITPVEAEWVGLSSLTADCDRAPDHRHARNVVHQPKPVRREAAS